jgi:glycosyltransferase involved in cell wall biosynthesis
VNTNSTLIEAMQNMGAPDLIVAADLDTLPAATAIAGDVGCFCAFDAHEYWPYAFPEFREWEISFWLEVERQLSQLANLRVAVSQPLARIMSDEYGCEFLTLPNCATLAEGEVIDIEAVLARRGVSDPMQVIFLGNFAEGRGLEETIRAFANVKSDTRLILQGHDNSYKGKLIELARSLGLGEERVSFPPAVPESALVETAAKADIGLIPYNPAYFGYRYCCPNKFSQYMAGGLPILSSSTEYVAGIVKRENLGEVVDIDDPWAFAATIDRLNERRHELPELGRRARQYFQEHYHWEAVVSSIMQRIEAGCKLTERYYTRVDLDWIASASARRAGHGTVGLLDPTLFGAELVASIRSRASRDSRMLRGLWHLVPTQVRYTFVEWLRRRIS